LNFADAKETDIRPLSEEERSRLTTNLSRLLKSIEPESIIDHLFQKQCINEWQKQHLIRESTDQDKNTDLINILIKRSFANFKDFVCILKKTGQGHVADVIGEPGGLLKMLRFFLRRGKFKTTQKKVIGL
jgi:Caspase recruitment domain